jgi:peptidoglycan/LPS O-acetylase OafA/YrhL
LWSFALFGLALKWLDRRSALLAYLADSSYWVYLVHLPVTIGFGVLLFGLPMHALLKIAINIAATTLVCLATYHQFVRFTGLGALLNGRRHVRRSVPKALPTLHLEAEPNQGEWRECLRRGMSASG